MRKLLIVMIIFWLGYTFSDAIAAEDYVNAPRRDTVIFDNNGGRVTTPLIWNPYLPGTCLNQGFMQALMEPLFILNYETGEIEPWLGESFTVNDTMDQWTLKLRKGIRWSDGEPLTADDVVFTVKMVMNTPELVNISVPEIRSSVKEVKKVDDLTALFILKEPNPRFQLDNFSVKVYGSFNIAPEHIWKDHDPRTFTNYDPEKGWPVYTGPYKLASANETEFVYVRDDNWWGAKAGFKPLPKPKKLVWTWAGPEETRAALMAEGKIDSLMDVTLGTFRAIKARNPKVIAWQSRKPYVWLDPAPRNLEFNTTLTPWNDPEMRWAINKIIDRNRIVKIAYEGTTIASRSPFPAYPAMNRYVDLMKGNPDFEKLWDVDVPGAQKIFESKGYVKKGAYYEKSGRQLALTIESNETEIELNRIADQLVEMFQAAGINATHRKVAAATYTDNLLRCKFEAAAGYYQLGSVNEPWATLDTTNNRWLKPVGELAGGDYYRWDNRIFSDAVNRIGVLPLGDPKIDDLVITALAQYYKELPTIPLTEARKLVPFDTTYWTNWPTAENNYLQPATWWQSTHKIIHSLEHAE
jgi:peptide/nickel transport system substrate-binding protein